MPDYAACNNKECLKRHECCRYLMVLSEHQWSIFIEGDGSDCEYFWPLEEGAPFKIEERE